MTDPIQHLRELMAKATPGMWHATPLHGIQSSNGIVVFLPPHAVRMEAEANAALTVAAINALPALLDRLEAGEKDAAEWKESSRAWQEQATVYHLERDAALAKVKELERERDVCRSRESQALEEVAEYLDVLENAPDECDTSGLHKLFVPGSDKDFRSKCDQARAEVERLRKIATELLNCFVHPGHPGEPCLQTGWVPVSAINKYRAALAGQGGGEG